jgi:predicted amidohydrolase
MMRTRAFENQCFIAFTHPQQSLVTNPKGRIIANEQDDGPAVCICDVDLSEARDDNHIRDRRPDLYGIITEDK